jgi:hypothetical protein
MGCGCESSCGCGHEGGGCSSCGNGHEGSSCGCGGDVKEESKSENSAAPTPAPAKQEKKEAAKKK